MSPLEESVAPATPSRLHNLRWWVCGLLFIVTVINYLDREIFSILAPTLQHAIGWSQLDYSHIVIAFQAAYAISYLLSGRVLDKIGTKLGWTLAYSMWGVAEIAHAFVRTVFGFGVVRFFLGLSEAASFPGGMKAIAEWFPASETGLAAGLFNSAPTVAGIVGPLTIPWVAAKFGWRATFIFNGALGIVWVAVWLAFYKKPSSLSGMDASTGEAPLPSDRASSNLVPWKRLVRYRQFWAVVTAKGLTDPVWFFFLFWLPLFLAEKHGITGTAVIPYLTTVYVCAGIGSVVGGYTTSLLVKKGWSINRSRKVTMAGTAVITPFVIFAANAQNTWTAVLLIAMTIGAHQSWSSLVFNLGPDLFPSKAVGSVIGFAGMVSSAATVVFSEFTGLILEHNAKYYLPMFIACGFAYMFALICVHLLSPRLERVPLA